MSVSGSSVTEATISNLTLSTNYTIQVAAVNSAGTGVYSDPPITAGTLLESVSICDYYNMLYTCIYCRCVSESEW